MTFTVFSKFILHPMISAGLLPLFLTLFSVERKKNKKCS